MKRGGARFDVATELEKGGELAWNMRIVSNPFGSGELYSKILLAFAFMQDKDDSNLFVSGTPTFKMGASADASH